MTVAHVAVNVTDWETAKQFYAAVLGPLGYRVVYEEEGALAYYADADYSEIASQLGLTRTHVGVLLCRAKQMLRQELADTNDQATLRVVGGRDLEDAGRSARGKATEELPEEPQ